MRGYDLRTDNVDDRGSGGSQLVSLPGTRLVSVTGGDGVPKVAGRAGPEVVVMEALYDERRSARFRHVVSSLNHSSTSEQSAPDQVSAALDRILIADAMTQVPGRTSGGDRALLLSRMYYRT